MGVAKGCHGDQRLGRETNLLFSVFALPFPSRVVPAGSGRGLGLLLAGYVCIIDATVLAPWCTILLL